MGDRSPYYSYISNHHQRIMKITTDNDQTAIIIFCITINITFLCNIQVFNDEGLFTKKFLAVTAPIPGTWVLLTYNVLRFTFNVCWKLGKRAYRWYQTRRAARKVA